MHVTFRHCLAKILCWLTFLIAAAPAAAQSSTPFYGFWAADSYELAGKGMLSFVNVYWVPSDLSTSSCTSAHPCIFGVQGLFFDSGGKGALKEGSAFTSAMNSVSSAIGSNASNILAFFLIDEPFATANLVGVNRSKRRTDIETLNAALHNAYSGIKTFVNFSQCELDPCPDQANVNDIDGLRPPPATTLSLPSGTDWMSFDCYQDTGQVFDECGIGGQTSGIPALFEIAKGLVNSERRIILIPPGQITVAAPYGNDVSITDQDVANIGEYHVRYWKDIIANSTNRAYLVGVMPYWLRTHMDPETGCSSLPDCRKRWGIPDLPERLRDAYKWMGKHTIESDFASNPAMALDGPTNNSTVNGSYFIVGGWAVDLGGVVGSGVDVVHIYAWQGSTPTFLGATAVNGSRSDVSAAFGAQFEGSGYTMAVTNLAPGDYVLGVYAYSNRTLSFNQSAFANIHVN